MAPIDEVEDPEPTRTIPKYGRIGYMEVLAGTFSAIGEVFVRSSSSEFQ